VEAPVNGDSWRAPTQRVLVALALVVASGLILRSVHKFYPLQDWLVWRYLAYWLLTGYFVLGCVAVGFSLTRLTLGRVLPVREMLALSAPLGLLAYFWWAFLAGLLGWYGSAFFALTPLGFILVGGAPALGYVQRLARHVRHQRILIRKQSSWWAWPVIAFGFVGFLWIYFSILSPNNIAYDARWYHLPLAEQYTAAGKIFRFPEGWVMGTYPQLSSLLYAWAFQLPGSVFDKVALCAHLEFAFVVLSVVAVPVLTRRLLPKLWRPRPRAALSWAAVFLFPGIFLYDSSLNVSADHIAALWAIPIYLVLLRVWQRVGVRECILLAAFLSGAMLTKYTAAMIAIPAVVGVLGRAAWLLAAGKIKRSQVALGASALCVVGLLLTTAHWLKNWIWYGDPLYPQLHDQLTLRPWATEANVPYNFDIAVPWHAARSLAGLIDTLRVTATFAFKHHDWPDLHGEAPVFGFLFTVSLLVLPFLGRHLALWGLFLTGHVGVMLWCNISWQDRYLQVLVPWMAAAVAAVVILVWQLGAIARVAMGVLLAAQILWGADVYFFSTHRIIGSPVKASIDLIESGRLKHYKERFDVFGYLGKVADVLPKDAVVLFRESRQTFGLRVRRVTDRPGTQGVLYYNRYRTPAALFSELKGMGITHILWGRPEGVDTIASDIIFHDFVSHFLVERQVINGLNLAKLPATLRSAVPFGRKIAYLGCPGAYPAGLYPLEKVVMSVFDPSPKYPKPDIPFVVGAQAEAIFAAADYVAWTRACVPAAASGLRNFETIGQRGDLTYLRRPGVR